MNGEWTRALRSPLAVAGALLVAGLVAAAVLAPVLAPYEPQALAGSALAPPSSRHLLGTNGLGQDVLSQIIWGARRSLVVAVGAASLGIAAGTLVGMGAGLLGGWADMAAMRTVDVFLGLPRLPLLILVGAMVGAGITTITVLIGVMLWPAAARIVRSQVLTLRQRGFIGAARGFGYGPGYLMRRHLIPAVVPVIVAVFVAFAANAVMLEATLAFLGLGDPVGVSWGLMLNQALTRAGLYFTPAWAWLVLPAGFAITLAVVGFSFLGAGLEPALNPRIQEPQRR